MNMNPTHHRLIRWLGLVVPACLFVVISPLIHAQSTAPVDRAAAPAAGEGKGDGRPDGKGTTPTTAAEAKSQELVDDGEETVVLSAFEVTAEAVGYYATNAMSGTRLNSKVEDLASPITVITTTQMDDFAMLDIHDIFAYEAGTEGKGNYTDFEVNTSGNPNDNTMAEPNTANRIRGVGSANVSLGNFETSGRVPVDRLGMEGLEISRGPSSTIFGLGNAAGTVNMVPATANVTRDRIQVQLRGDSYGGFRQHLDFNRVLIKDKLAVRFNQVFQRTAYDLKPSGEDMQRYSGMIKYRPFRNTEITASYLHYKQEGNRPNSLTPIDAITPWLANGSPTWDPLLGRVFVNDVVVGSSMGAYNLVSGFQTSGRGSSLLYIDVDGVTRWAAPRGTSGTNPLTPNQSGFNYAIPRARTYRATQPLFSSDTALSDKSLYDWSEVNLAAMNRSQEETGTFLLQASQVILDTDRHYLAAQVGWFREDSERDLFFLNGKPASSGPTGGVLTVDVNRRLLDGSPNPNYLRPYLQIGDDLITESPLLNDTYRGQLAYRLDLTREKNPLRWLGVHQFSGYYEYKDFQRRNYHYRHAMVDDHAWLPAGAPRANNLPNLYGSLPYNQASATGTRNHYIYYVGDAIGNNIDYAPGDLTPGVYGYTWGNAQTGVFQDEPTELGLAGVLAGTGGAANILKIQKTEGAVLQSRFLEGKIVTTFGVRRDRIFIKNGVTPQLLPDGITHDHAWDEQWLSEWFSNEGRTKTTGVVLKPFSWLNLYGNKSDSFLPADPAVNLQGEYLPNPSGIGEDFGFLLKLFDSKLTIRVNRYENRQVNSRNGSSTTLAIRASKMDIYDGVEARNFGLDYQAAQWIQEAAGGSLTPEQLHIRVAEAMQMTPERLTILSDEAVTKAETDDLLAKGAEIELNYQPTRYWRMKLNVTKQESIESNLSPGLRAYLEERMPVWQSIIDPRSGENWYTSHYDLRDPNALGFSPESYLPAQVNAPLQVALAKEGTSRPQIRKYRVNYSTNYSLNGLTDHRFWSKVSLGGALRWEDKGAIGYYGITDDAGIYQLLDATRPIYDKDHLYIDVSLGYRTKLFSGKVGANFQLNVRNVEESGRLQPIAAFPNGEPSSFRIISPRQFILTVTFDL